ncbi:S-type anion channel like [Melia azedarach]|uniref:S-type anion channel like n=1 Tax=Melia azedarach TaxID=155640 RepID=A0ACC1WXR9_MELAZ|nr:S-type anion channel like [Melia azedarach]
MLVLTTCMLPGFHIFSCFNLPPKLFSTRFPNSVLCWVFSGSKLFLLDIKIYGQWFTTQKRFFIHIANPTSQISVIAETSSLHEQQHRWVGKRALFACFLSDWLITWYSLSPFISVYQACSNFPCILRPTFFLFFAAPSIGSLTWYSISGAFDITSKMLFFLSLFLFISLACRPVLFKKSMRKFNVAWWAYSFTSTFWL